MRLIFVDCQLARAGFSSECAFTIPLLKGEEYVGVAPRDYCCKADGSPLGPDEPHADQPMAGKVAARTIHNGGETARVALPDGEAITVASSLVSERAGGKAHVSV